MQQRDYVVDVTLSMECQIRLTLESSFAILDYFYDQGYV